MDLANYDWVGSFVNWYPLLLVCAVWLYFFRALLPARNANRERQERQTAALERIAAALEKRA